MEDISPSHKELLVWYFLKWKDIITIFIYEKHFLCHFEVIHKSISISQGKKSSPILLIIDVEQQRNSIFVQLYTELGKYLSIWS